MKIVYQYIRKCEITMYQNILKKTMYQNKGWNEILRNIFYFLKAGIEQTQAIFNYFLFPHNHTK